MPSTTSSSVSSDFASSTVITPSSPTFFMASARNLPISLSPFGGDGPDCAISSFEVTLLEFFCRSATTASTARSTPRLRSIGFMPAATALAPSLTIACASTVAVVRSVARCVGCTGGGLAHHLSAHVLESLVELDLLGDGDAILGDAGGAVGSVARADSCRPSGPSVTRTASARVSMPRAASGRARRPRISRPWQSCSVTSSMKRVACCSFVRAPVELVGSGKRRWPQQFARVGELRRFQSMSANQDIRERVLTVERRPTLVFRP